MYDIHGLNEECGLFGIWNHTESAHLTYMGLQSLQHRGQEGAGIVCSNGQNLIGERGLGLLTEVYHNKISDISRISACYWSCTL